jgi:hypothetical protein
MGECLGEAPALPLLFRFGFVTRTMRELWWRETRVAGGNAASQQCGEAAWMTARNLVTGSRIGGG